MRFRSSRPGRPPRRRAMWSLLAVVILGAVAPPRLRANPIVVDPRARTIFGVAMPGTNNLVQVYRTANGFGFTFLDPPVPTNPLNVGDQPYYNFFNVLNRSFGTFNGWNITGNAQALSAGSIQVHTYSAVGTATRVGAQFDVQYVPGAKDPAANMHWIQVVSDNHNITNNPGHGNLENVVDLAGDNTRTPYYDTGTPVVANSRNLIDTPGRTDVEQSHNWQAALFLVSGPNAPGTAANPATITVYNDSGIYWGWDDVFINTNNAFAFLAQAEADLKNDLPNLPPDEFALYDQQLRAQLTPEPSTMVLALVGVAAGGLARRLKPRAAA